MSSHRSVPGGLGNWLSKVKLIISSAMHMQVLIKSMQPFRSSRFNSTKFWVCATAYSCILLLPKPSWSEAISEDSYQWNIIKALKIMKIVCQKVVCIPEEAVQSLKNLYWFSKPARSSNRSQKILINETSLKHPKFWSKRRCSLHPSKTGQSHKSCCIDFLKPGLTSNQSEDSND